MRCYSGIHLGGKQHKEKVQILGFSVPVRFRGHFEEIGIAKVLLNTKPCRVGKFRGCRFSDV